MDVKRSGITTLLMVATGCLGIGIIAGTLVAQPRSAAYDITREQFDAMLAGGTDDSLRILDQGKYLIGVGMNRRGRLDRSAPAGRGNAGTTGQGRGTSPAVPAAAVACGTPGTPSSNAVGGLLHTVAAETYVITAGAGVLVTGGHIVNGRRSEKGSPLETIQNGPSCSGMIDGPDVVKRMVKQGDVVIIPANTPHGWESIPAYIDYVSIRTDPDKVMTNNFVHPVIQKMQGSK